MPVGDQSDERPFNPDMVPADDYAYLHEKPGDDTCFDFLNLVLFGAALIGLAGFISVVALLLLLGIMVFDRPAKGAWGVF